MRIISLMILITMISACTNQDNETQHKGGYILLIQAVGQWEEPGKVNYLLLKGVDPNERGTDINGEIEIPLHIAIQWEDHTDDFETVKRLLEEPEIDLSIKNGQGMTPLEYAQHMEQNDEIVDYLVRISI